MTALALAAVLPEVHVVIAVASNAIGAEFDLVSGLLVTAVTCQRAVRAAQRKAGFLAVVELPDAPAIGGMTLGALLAERALVHVGPFVTGEAIRGHLAVVARHVTLFARNCHVQAQQWKARQVMVEVGDLAPAILGVALVALTPQLAAVHVTGAMAAVAFVAELLRRDGGGMTGMTIDLGVPPIQSPVAIPGMIKGGLLPLVVTVAAAAILSQPPRMAVLSLMATEAVLGNLRLQIAAAMTVAAIDVGVHPFQGEAGLLLVIEFAGLPARGRMTLAAFRAALATMHIIGCVAGGTGLRRVLVVVAEMAAQAGYLDVFVVQRETRLVMVETDLLPARGVVTGGAIAPELAVVGIYLAVAVHARRRRLAVRLVRRVTSAASDRSVRALQRKLGCSVIELVAIEFDDVAIATEMLAVAGPALRARNSRQLAVKAARAVNIRSDVLVTVQAQLILPVTIAAIVTAGALLLVFLMGRGYLARHEQGLRVHAVTARYRKQQQHECEQQRMSFSLPHEIPIELSVDVHCNDVHDSGGHENEDQG